MLVAAMPRAKTVVAQGFAEGNPLQPLVVKHLGLTRFEEAAAAMRAFTAARDADTPDEIWLTEHAPVYTLGLAGKREHVLDARGIPVLQTDRGGQVTYHGPGQVVAYVLVDLKPRGITVRRMVTLIEAAVLATLGEFGVAGHRRAGMPGVYVGDAAAGDKIAALGLKVKHGCTYHGVSLNVDLDIAPFGGINPCGYESLRVTSLKELGVKASSRSVGERLAAHLEACLIQARGAADLVMKD
jgi:lipoyl(octanoyl) transferase